MSDVRVIADDLTGACDVGAEFARAGHRVLVAVTPGHRQAHPGTLLVVNTQSRAVTPRAAAARVRDACRDLDAPILFKKIDTALRGHLGAELDAALAACGAATCFLVPAIPAEGRTTRGGAQWLDGRPLASTEFADDPEGAGAESSVAAVLARESDGDTVGVGTSAVRKDGLRSGVARFVVVDADEDADVERAVAAVFQAEAPFCVAGSIALAAAVAARTAPTPRHRSVAAIMEGPVLVVAGSLHSKARAQLDAACSAGLAVRVEVSPDGVTAAARTARGHLKAGRNVIIAPPAVHGTPEARDLRRTEASLASVAARVARGRRLGSLILIGGETSFAVLRKLGVGELAVRDRIAPLVPISTVVGGPLAGTTVVTKGGSGGRVNVVADLLARTLPAAVISQSMAR